MHVLEHVPVHAEMQFSVHPVHDDEHPVEHAPVQDDEQIELQSAVQPVHI